MATTAPAAESAPAESGEPVTIEWWHIQNNDPGKADWQAMADAFTAEHPNVTINITVMENEAFKAALQTNLQAGDVPDLFQSWGGGGLRDQVAAGLVQDITDATSSWIGDLGAAPVGLYQVDGKQYGVPFDAGIVGFWYNKDLFAQAGLDAPADTWDGLLEQVQTLKDAGITPIAVGAGDKWPAHFWYSYLMVRLGGADAMNEIAATNNFDVPNVIEAGQKVADLVALDPFQAGFLGAGWDAPDGESGTIASQGAAMDLMGQWAPGAFRTQAGVQTQDEMPFELGWAPFPSVEGGSGAGTDVFGGGNGFAVGKDAPPEAVEFLHFLTNEQNQETWAKNSGLPVNPGCRRRRRRPEHAGRARRTQLGDVHAAVPRPVLLGRGRISDQRPDRTAVRRPDHARGRSGGDHRGRPRRVALARGWEAVAGLPPATLVGES